MKLEIFSTDYENYSNIKSYEKPFSESPVFASGRTNGQTDMTTLIVVFSEFTKAPKTIQ